MSLLIKICGITTPELAYQTALAGADYIGIICFNRSRRYVEPSLAKEISYAAKAGGATPVLVCVEDSCDDMLALADKTSVNIVQLHGNIAQTASRQLPNTITKIYVISIDQYGKPINLIPNSLDKANDFLLFDGKNAGSGHTIPGHYLQTIAQGYRYFLAGGLSLDNVSDALRQCSPIGVDLSSSLEDNRGIKILDKIHTFIQFVQQEGIYESNIR